MTKEKCKHQKVLMYDGLIAMGGAEKLTMSLFNGLAFDRLVVGYVNRSLFEKTNNISEISASSAVPGLGLLKLFFSFYTKSKHFNDVDIVLYSGIAPVVGALRQKRGKKVYYCHTPPRFVYDLKDFYRESANWWQKPLLPSFRFFVDLLYRKSLNEMDVIIANSRNVQNRLKSYYNLDSVIIYPPIDLSAFHWQQPEGYYLSTARLERFKRVDLVVKAFLQMPDRKLVVASGGPELEKLMGLAQGSQNITFTNWCSDGQLKQLMAKSIASIYVPMNEDFGMSPVESMAAGKPVIGVSEGGVKETVVDGVTGILCPAEPDVEDIVEAVKIVDEQWAVAQKEACIDRAQLFSEENFLNAIEQVLAANGIS